MLHNVTIVLWVGRVYYSIWECGPHGNLHQIFFKLLEVDRILLACGAIEDLELLLALVMVGSCDEKPIGDSVNWNQIKLVILIRDIHIPEYAQC